MVAKPNRWWGTGIRACVSGRMEVLRYVLPHLLAGCLAGVVASVGIVATNVARLRDLIVNTQGGWMAFGLLTFGLVVTFGSLAMGGAIMAIGSGDER